MNKVHQTRSRIVGNSLTYVTPYLSFFQSDGIECQCTKDDTTTNNTNKKIGKTSFCFSHHVEGNDNKLPQLPFYTTL